MQTTQEQKFENIRSKNSQKELESLHYYGDKVRTIFIIAAIIIIVMAPFFRDRIPFREHYTVLGVMVLAMLAGLTNPKLRSIIVLDFIASIFSFLIFGTEALVTYSQYKGDTFFWANLVLSVITIFGIYYSSKTLRGNLMMDN